MKEFGVEPVGGSLPLLDEYLKKHPKNVVVILLDGMGVSSLRDDLDETGFFRSHLAGSFSSTFPPTTVAATASVESGLMPCEHGRLGWTCYYPQIDKIVTVYRNTISGTDVPAADHNLAERYTGFESIFDRFRRYGAEAHKISPFSEPYPETFGQITEMIVKLCRSPGRKYIYAYWPEPDGVMHRTGCSSEETKRTLRELQKQVRCLCGELDDSLVVVTADHGHKDTSGVPLTDFPDLMECLEMMPSVEPRAMNLFIKPGKEDIFRSAFERLFGDSYVLLSKKEVLDVKLFGEGKEHSGFRSMIGDYVAVAVGGMTVFDDVDDIERFRSTHAGLTPEEMTIPLIVAECD